MAAMLEVQNNNNCFLKNKIYFAKENNLLFCAYNVPAVKTSR